MEIGKIIDDYLLLCAHYCEEGGFSKFDLNREQIKSELIREYSKNGDVPIVAKFIDKLNLETISFIQEERLRLFTWMDDFSEKKLRSRLSTLLQTA